MRKNLYWLSDREWKRIEPHLPRDVRGKMRVDDRRHHSCLAKRLPVVRLPAGIWACYHDL